MRLMPENVTVLPCLPGDVIYYYCNEQLIEVTVDRVLIETGGIFIVCSDDSNHYYCISAADFEKNCFLRSITDLKRLKDSIDRILGSERSVENANT